MCTVGHAKLSEQLIFQTGGCLHQKLTTSLGGGSTSFFIFLPILEKKRCKKYEKVICTSQIRIPAISQLSMFFGGGPFLLHIFTQLKLAMYVGSTASAQTVPYAPVGSTGFRRTYC